MDEVLGMSYQLREIRGGNIGKKYVDTQPFD
jgi:hypothetical protein